MFNVNFRLLKTIYVCVHLLVCYLNYKVHGVTIKIAATRFIDLILLRSEMRGPRGI